MQVGVRMRNFEECQKMKQGVWKTKSGTQAH